MSPPQMPPSQYTSEQRINSIIRHISNLAFTASDLDALTKHPLLPFRPQPSHTEPLKPKALLLYKPSQSPSERKVKRLLTHLHLLEVNDEERRRICRFLRDRASEMRRCPVDRGLREARVEVQREVRRCDAKVEIRREVRRCDMKVEVKKQERRYNTGMEIKRNGKGQYECLVEEEEARKRHVGPYKYQTPGEVEYRLNWRILGLPGW